MTQEDLDKLSYAHEDTIDLDFLDRWDLHQAYNAGFKKALELVLNALDNAPIYTHYDMEDVLEQFRNI